MDPQESDSEVEVTSIHPQENLCGNVSNTRVEARDGKMKIYQSIIQGLAPENFDENSKLTSAFLSKFTCADVFLLIEAYGWNDPPGKGINVWASFAQRNPQHSETEWATIWTFWLFLNEQFKQWENRDQWRNGVPKHLLGNEISNCPFSSREH